MIKKKKQPLYQTIVDDLKRRIAAGEFERTLPFPSQQELTKMYNTSEITTRRALSELANEGILHRIQKKGTFLKLDENNQIENLQIPSHINKIFFVYHTNHLSIYEGSFYSDFLGGLRKACSVKGIEAQMWDMGDQFQLPDEDNIGLILLPSLPQASEIPMDVLRKWKEEDRKLVTIQYYYPNLQIPYVIVDNLTGGYLATEHLLKLGHTRVAIILTGKSYFEMNQEFTLRLQGYKLALDQHQIEFDIELVSVMEGNEESEEMGYKAFQQLAELPNPPSAIFATSDYKAIGVLKAAKDRGLVVPDDLSVVGYDNILISQFTSPYLTTIKQNSNLLGERAVDMFISGVSRNNMRDEIVPELIIRSSTKARN
ncbi:GntR family transcriptional regulator [Paenibacillus baekrokdamisoli]|uniref:GntR family transcriptional regulator n=1 Tax=Paenibacillus baekrokdamisoli TaxID=1712516 RepID=A0A3G9IN77_9BACL|nr:GntR family transcriptional regulator [Paenibacillus baekrokdamisoli]MBB3072025.1 DNA-binding LacI/PurR family transcriptional regulator [Paenibacillus baekrokdamisoli]BBH20327.1 GntR family transcriptional regulator [Paenibacillus baekrokdamisoli]